MALGPRVSLKFYFLVALVFISIRVTLYASEIRYDRAEFFQILYSQRIEASKTVQRLYYGEKPTFVETAINSEIDGPFDTKPLRDLCQKTQWMENLIMSCRAPQGGMGNVRNVFLNCIRYAIEAGATGLVVPEIIVRSETDLSHLTTNKIVDFDYLFDRAHLVTTLEEACPRMKVWSDINDLWDMPSTATPVQVVGEFFARKFVHETILADPFEWRGRFDEWLAEKNASLTRGKPTLLECMTPLFQWPVSYDGAPLANTFGRILRFRADTRRLAAVVLYELSEKFSLNINPNGGIATHAFYGAHLRTAYDAQKAGWPGYAAQAPTYIAQALNSSLSVIYVTSESAENVKQFRVDALKEGLNVTTKHDLLTGAELEELNSLTWDQQALVDYEVLLKSSKFGGLDKSSFAWNVALRRHVLTGEVGEGYLNRGMTLKDDLSLLVGGAGSMERIAAGMWP